MNSLASNPENPTLVPSNPPLERQFMALQLNNRQIEQQRQKMTASQMELIRLLIQQNQERDETIHRLTMAVESLNGH